MRISRYVSSRIGVDFIRSCCRCHGEKECYWTELCSRCLKAKRYYSTHMAIVKIVLMSSLLFSFNIQAQISNITIADVTTRAFSIVWVADNQVLSANVSLFADASGSQPVTTTIGVDVVSAGIADAHANGVVKIDVTELTSDTTYYFSIQSTTTQGSDIFPDDSSLLQVTTSVESSKVNSFNQPIVNDLINYGAHGFDGVTPLSGSLVLIDIPTVSNYPLSAFVGNNSALDESAVIDLNNLFDKSGVSIDVEGGEIMLIKEFRGLNCIGLQSHSVSRFSKVPQENGIPKVTTLQSPDSCFASDRNCDQIVNILDFQFVLNSFNSMSGECAFNRDADIVTDQVINILDVQRVLNDFGQSVP